MKEINKSQTEANKLISESKSLGSNIMNIGFFAIQNLETDILAFNEIKWELEKNLITFTFIEDQISTQIEYHNN